MFLALIGRWFGGEAVGIVAFTFKVSEFLMPFRVVSGRLIVPLLAPITDNKNYRMNLIQQKASELEMLITVPLIICGLALYFFFAIPYLGTSWNKTFDVLPWVLIGRLLIVPHAASLSALNIKGFFVQTILITIFGILLETTMLWLLGKNYGLEGIGAATISFWLPFLIINWVAIKRLSFTWNFHSQLWAWAGVFFCLSINFGLGFNVGFIIVILLTWTKIRALINEIISVFFETDRNP